LDFGVFVGFFGVPDIFAMPGIWGESGAEKRAKRPGEGGAADTFWLSADGRKEL
jgi:hypothetical protein